MIFNEAFVYCWTDHLTNKLYVGSHKGTVDDGYVCSSKLMMEQYNIRPQDFTRQILAEGLFNDIRKMESKILDSINAKIDEQFYNQHNGNGNFYVKEHTQLTKEKISNSHKGKIKSTTHIQNIAASAKERLSVKENNPMYGKKHSEETKQKISNAKKGKPPWNKGMKFK